MRRVHAIIGRMFGGLRASLFYALVREFLRPGSQQACDLTTVCNICDKGIRIGRVTSMALGALSSAATGLAAWRARWQLNVQHWTYYDTYQDASFGTAVRLAVISLISIVKKNRV